MKTVNKNKLLIFLLSKFQISLHIPLENMKQILCNSCLTLHITLSKVLDVTLIKLHPKQLLHKSYMVVLIFCLLVLLFS